MLRANWCQKGGLPFGLALPKIGFRPFLELPDAFDLPGSAHLGHDLTSSMTIIPTSGVPICGAGEQGEGAAVIP